MQNMIKMTKHTTAGIYTLVVANPTLIYQSRAFIWIKVRSVPSGLVVESEESRTPLDIKDYISR
jgi:hypothetical protein